MKPTAMAGSLAVLALVACTPMGQQPIETRSNREPAREPEVAAEAAGSQTMAPMLDQIRADAAQRAGVPVDHVKVLSVAAVTWADGSLGCPEPGMMYTQALVRGYRIGVDAAGTNLVYHAGPHNRFVYCPPERARPPSLLDPT